MSTALKRVRVLSSTPFAKSWPNSFKDSAIEPSSSMAWKSSLSSNSRSDGNGFSTAA